VGKNNKAQPGLAQRYQIDKVWLKKWEKSHEART
jgi:hypothetical protein